MHTYVTHARKLCLAFAPASLPFFVVPPCVQELADSIIVSLMGTLSDPGVRRLVRPMGAIERVFSVLTSQISTFRVFVMLRSHTKQDGVEWRWGLVMKSVPSEICGRMC